MADWWNLLRKRAFVPLTPNFNFYLPLYSSTSPIHSPLLFLLLTLCPCHLTSQFHTVRFPEAELPTQIKCRVTHAPRIVVVEVQPTPRGAVWGESEREEKRARKTNGVTKSGDGWGKCRFLARAHYALFGCNTYDLTCDFYFYFYFYFFHFSFG